MVAFLTGSLSPDSAPAVHTSRREKKEHAKGKNNSAEIHDVARPRGSHLENSLTFTCQQRRERILGEKNPHHALRDMTCHAGAGTQ